jgi:hypothetical protein
MAKPFEKLQVPYLGWSYVCRIWSIPGMKIILDSDRDSSQSLQR